MTWFIILWSEISPTHHTVVRAVASGYIKHITAKDKKYLMQ
jgi:hypothetical protein